MSRCIAVLFVLSISCKQGDPAPVPNVSVYLPMQKGAVQMFSVDSVVINQNVETSYSYLLRTEVIDSIPNAENGFTFVIKRSKQVLPTSPWSLLESWSARVTQFEAVISEGNISYIRISGPLENEKTWDGNALNILGGSEKCVDGDTYNCDNYVITNFAKPYELENGNRFENTVTVVQSDNKDLIVFQDKRAEVYGKGVGLLYKEVTQLNYCTDPSCLGMQFVNSGLRYSQMMIDHGL